MVRGTDSVISKIVAMIVKKVNPEKIILFGSFARGDASDASDIDLLIVEKEPFSSTRSRWQETRKIRKAISSIKHPKDILVYNIDEMEKWRHSRNHIICKSLDEGKVIYER